LKNQNKDQFTPLQYDAQLKAAKETLKEHGIHISQWTHAGRKAGLQQAEMLDIPDPQLRQLGRWENSRMNQHYSNNIPRQALRIMAGQDGGSGSFYLSRECLDPPPELKQLIFPRLEESIKLVDTLPYGSHTRSTYASLELFKWFRTILLQDVVSQTDLYPDSPLWRYPPFNLPSFMEYKERAKMAMENDTHPKSIQLQKIMPEISNQIRTQARVIEDNFKIVRNLLTVTDANLKCVANDIQDGKENTENLTQGYREVCSTLENWRNSFINAITSGVNAGTDEFINVLSNQPLIVSPSPVPSASLAISSTTVSAAPLVPTVITAIPASPSPEIPRKNLSSIVEVWEEWEEGLVIGANGLRSQSIKYMDREYGKTWRRGEAIRKRYERRMHITQRIRKLATNHRMTEEDIVLRIDRWRQRKRYSVDKLGKEMHKEPEKGGWSDEELLRYGEEESMVM
jgi:Centromere DNA-binding protein complex CBF3 subunit, domain 2/Transcriptional activator of glycolytic enzymes